MFEAVVADQRLLARFVNLAHRFGCEYADVNARAHDHATRVRIAFTGEAEALRRLRAQLERLVADDGLRHDPVPIP